MAKAEIKMPDEFLERLSKLGAKTDEITEKVLEAGGKVMLDRIRSELDGIIGADTKQPSRSTGELSKALGLTAVRQDRNGNSNIKIGFAEPRSDGDSNAKIANILEYGKSGQPAKPFLKPAKTAAKSACESTMVSTFEEEVGKV